MTLRVTAVIPGDGQGASMIFCRRQVDRLETMGVVVHRFFLRSRSNLLGIMKEANRLRSEVRQFRPHVIHAHYGTMTGWVCGVIDECPLVVTFRGSDLNPVPSGPFLRTKAGHRLSHWSASLATRIICVSRELMGRLSSKNQEKAVVIPMGVSTSKFRPLPREWVREQIRWPQGPVLLFNAGREPQVKRLDLALEAYAVAKATVPSLRMEIMRGDVEPDFVPMLLNAADVLIVASDFEGSPNIVKEAIACGLPIVSVPVGDVPERLSKVSPSQIVERDSVLLGEAVARLVLDGRRSNGPSVAAAELDEEITTHKVLQVLQEAAERIDG